MFQELTEAYPGTNNSLKNRAEVNSWDFTSKGNSLSDMNINGV